MEPLAYIPSPSQGVWHLGPIPIRAYAVMIILGIVVAVWLGERRWAAKGGTSGVIIDVAVWAVPFGLVGGRLYHVVTDYQRYFGEGGDTLRALEIWKGGLGIWGAVAAGGLGAVIACRRRGISALALADAVAPGIVLAQAIGRWGNYWNQELYGRPLDAFWAVDIDESHRPVLDGGPALDPKYADIAHYHPTFLYESLWCVGVAILILWADRRYKLTHGRAFALYVAAYTVGRAWIEALRIDDAHEILGLRLNDWTSFLLFVAAVAYMYQARGRTDPEIVVVPGAEPVSDTPATAEPESESETEARAKDDAADAAEEPADEQDDPAPTDAEADEPEKPERPEDADQAEDAEEAEDAVELEKGEPVKDGK
ncbi:prolipoprotein diacylglyceryl transferase [Actinomadura meridiana]|uniref:Phosphatidylglycerol--prolipoprotein diacylglyceryl transferase n=1 Tax=Actinomadura meridiana TaxID=559626 RepID=A0ABP8BZ09_9ACTN